MNRKRRGAKSQRLRNRAALRAGGPADLRLGEWGGRREGTQSLGKNQIPATALVGTLERLSWIRGTPQDGGVFDEHSKSFPGANVTALLEYSNGVPVGYIEGWEDQTITKCCFIKGTYKPNDHPWNSDKLPLGKVDPVAISEDAPEDIKKLRHYFNHVVKARGKAAWKAYYEARQFLE